MSHATQGRTTSDQDFKPEKRVVAVNGRDFDYLVAGNGPPVLLIHGLSGSSRWWWRNMPALAREFTVYVVDLPGFGPMRRDQAGFMLAEAAGWLADWIRLLHLEPVHIVAHSLGGYIGIRLAAEHPELVHCLVLVAPAGVPEDKPFLAYSVSLLRAARQLRPRFATLLAHDFLRAGPRTILRAARDLLSEDVRHDLGKIPHTTLLVWGGDDPIIPPTIGTVFRKEIGDARLLVIDECGHVPMIDRYDEFNTAVLAFLHGNEVGE